MGAGRLCNDNQPPELPEVLVTHSATVFSIQAIYALLHGSESYSTALFFQQLATLLK